MNIVRLLTRTARDVAVAHGYFVAYGYLVFRLLARVTGWYLGGMLTRRIRDSWPRVAASAYDQCARKATPRWQDLRVLVGVAATIVSAGLAQSHNPILTGVGAALAVWHLFGIAVYHVNVLLFDEFYLEHDPRVWSYRRVFLQAVINVVEAVIIFAVLYGVAQRDVTFSRSLFWSVPGLTLNLPSDWQPGGIAPRAATIRVWVGQVAMSLFFVVVVLALIGAAMFKRPEIAAERQRAYAVGAGDDEKRDQNALSDREGSHRRGAAGTPNSQSLGPVWFLGASWLCVLTGLLLVGVFFLFWLPAMPAPVDQAFPSVPADRWGRLLALYLFTMLGSHLLTFFSLVGLRRLTGFNRAVEYEPRNAWLPIFVGFCESILYPTAWLVGRLEFIGFWIALKAAGQWKAWQNGEDHEGRRRFLVFLIGSALSLLFASLGFWFMKVFVLIAAP